MEKKRCVDEDIKKKRYQDGRKSEKRDENRDSKR